MGDRRMVWLAFVSIAALGCEAEPASPPCRSARCEALAESFEYIVVGSGAGGGPLASLLARAGHSVLLLEAGGESGGRTNYQVPAVHPQSTEDPALSSAHYVQHHHDGTR